jgi:hypothetical protein
MALNEKVVYCQIDAHLDTNPKIRRAGRNGRDVFEFILRRVAIGRTPGTVPVKYIEPWYLADQLMMSEDDARDGTSRAVTASLISIDETAGVVRVVGWSAEWGRRPKDGSERTADWRNRQPKPLKSDKRVTLGNEVSSHVTVRDESDAGEEKRGEEKRREEEIILCPAPAAPDADKAKPARKRGMPADWVPTRNDANLRAEAAATSRGVNLGMELSKARDWASSNAAKKADWDGFWRNWTRNAKPVAGQANLDKQLDRIRMLREQEAAEDAAKGES